MVRPERCELELAVTGQADPRRPDEEGRDSPVVRRVPRRRLRAIVDLDSDSD